MEQEAILLQDEQEDMVGRIQPEEASEEISEETPKAKKTKVKEPKVEEKKEMQVMDLPGVGAATAEKLASVGFDNLMALAVATPGELVNAAGVSEAVARKIINASRDGLDMGFSSGEDILAKRDSVMKISTGSKSFDAILGGGLETGCITECFGQYGSAKTQIAHMLCVTLQRDYPGSYAVYIDTENTFRPERIIQFAKGQGMDPTDVLRHIKVARAFNSDHQMLLIDKVKDIVTENGNVRLVIVDSLIAHFRAEFVGRGTLADRQQKLNKHMHSLSRIADANNIAIYLTNQVMSKPDQFFGDPTEAVGGHIVGHNSTFRIYLRRGKKGTRVAKLVDAPNMPDDEAIFMITEEGIEDA